MRQRRLLIFAGITAVLVVVAIFVQGGRIGPTTRSAGELLFPGLSDHLNDVAKVAVVSKNGHFTLTRSDTGWVLEEKGNYPARIGTVKKTLIGLAGLKTFEAKTREPASYSRIYVEDPKGDKPDSTLVTVSDGKGAVLASLIVGKLRFPKGGIGDTMTYVRKVGDAQSWLAEGQLDVGDSFDDWVDTDLLDVSSDRISQVTMTRQGSAPLVIERATDGSDKFVVKDLPAGAKITSDSDVRSRASALFGLQMENVRPATEVPFATQSAGKAEYRTLDGLVITINTARLDDQTWLSVEAESDETGRKPPPAEGEGEETKLKTLDEVRKEVEAINKKAGGWAFAVPAYKLDYIRSTLDDLLAKPDKGGDGAKSGG